MFLFFLLWWLVTAVVGLFSFGGISLFEDLGVTLWLAYVSFIVEFVIVAAIFKARIARLYWLFFGLGVGFSLGGYLLYPLSPVFAGAAQVFAYSFLCTVTLFIFLRPVLDEPETTE